MQNLPTYASRQINVAKIILFEEKRVRESKVAAAPKPTMRGAQRPNPNMLCRSVPVQGHLYFNLQVGKLRGLSFLYLLLTLSSYCKSKHIILPKHHVTKW